LVRQIRTMLKFATLTSDARFAAFLVDKAVHLKSQTDEVPPVGSACARCGAGTKAPAATLN
jgi:hypothetical protein